MELNQSQTKAIQHNKGPMLVLAGPGSGKTLVITQRTKKLIEEYKIKPESILVITFSKAAATEMKERFIREMNESRSVKLSQAMNAVPPVNASHTGVNFGTFHAVFFKILKYAYRMNASNIIREDEKFQYMWNAVHELQLELEDEKDFLDSVFAEISMVKSTKIAIENYYALSCSAEDFRRLYKGYDGMLRRTNKIDFDDMIVMCEELLVQRPDILAMWQQKYQYILVDEFQDANHLQYSIVRMLAAPQDNLFIVGDDDQSIYKFRGARPELMNQFLKDYPQAEKVLLDYNYRSKLGIVAGASRVIRNNGKRFDKKIRTNSSDTTGIVVQTFDTQALQNLAVLQAVSIHQKEYGSLSNLAVLYRTNTQPRILTGKFLEFNIPFLLKDSMPNLFEHFVAKQLRAYLSIACGSKKRADYLQIINKPNRYISRDCLDTAEIELYQIGRYYEEKPYVMDRIERLEYDLHMIRGMTPFAALKYIRKAIGYDTYLKEYAEYRKIKVEDLYETADEIMESAREFMTHEAWFDHIEAYGQELKKKLDEMKDDGKDRLVMMTFHASKGLEYDTVIIVDANEGIIPHHKSLLPEDMEEERRMFYVAMTRAKHNLYIFSEKERYGKQMEVSRFVNELLDEKTTRS